MNKKTITGKTVISLGNSQMLELEWEYVDTSESLHIKPRRTKNGNLYLKDIQRAVKTVSEERKNKRK